MILFDKFIDLGEEICENNSFIQNQMALGVTFLETEDLQGVSKTSFCRNWLQQILLMILRNPDETFANTSKTPSPSFTASKFVSLSTCDDLSSKAAIQSASAILSCNGVSQEVVVNDTQSDSFQYLNFAKK